LNGHFFAAIVPSKDRERMRRPVGRRGSAAAGPGRRKADDGLCEAGKLSRTIGQILQIRGTPMELVTEKYEGMVPYLLSQILDTCITGITLSDPDQEDNPIVYANESFELITGYNAEDILGRNCRFLQGDDREQEGIAKIREAVRERRTVSVVLRNYRKDGTLFYNQLTVRPLFDREGRLVYFLGLQYDITNQVEAEAELKRLNDLLRKAERG